MGDLESTAGNNVAAQKHYNDAIAKFEEKGDSLGQAHVLLTLGDLQRRLGDYVEAKKSYDESQAKYSRANNDLGQAQAYNGLGDLASEQKNYPVARAHYGKALQLANDKSPIVKANILMSLGTLEFLLGNHKDANDRYQEADLIYDLQNHQLGMARIQRKLGDLEKTKGRQDVADEHYAKAEKLFLDMEMKQEASNIRRLRSSLKDPR